MALPDSRNATFSDDTPVDPGTLNDLQDSVIARKHGELEFGLGRSSFVVIANAAYTSSVVARPGIDVSGMSLQTAEASLGFLAAGSRITTVEWNYDRAGVGTLTMSLVRTPKAAGLQAIVGAALAINAGTGTASSVVTFDHLMEAGYWYSLLVAADNAAHLFYGATVKATKP